MLPSRSASMISNIASRVRSFKDWYCLKTFVASLRSSSISPRRTMAACSRNWPTRFWALPIRASMRPARISRLFVSLVKSAFSAVNCVPAATCVSTLSPKSAISFRTAAMASTASLIWASIWSARLSTSAEDILECFLPAIGATSLSASNVAASASSVCFLRALSFSCSDAFRSLSTFSASSRSARRLASLSCSLATPMATLSQWKFSHLTPSLSSSTMLLRLQIRSSVSSGTTKPNSAFA
mmetsp:Transcript_86070/g.221627  ORF Transcript_86070/g.221627 Transcript_86070/m.221627 type:complete len:241 (+) Transcript_86070:985-1707(+)